ncbi:hypothetical protein, partial [Commensalibacter sp. Nvir]|uniref:hypothetical protein n=1 Tax=Commensalibacter sp. Nvir TaxID=3069817 RepID=UPI0030C7B674
DIELESKKDSPQTPQPLNLPKVVPINETTKLFTKSVQVLQERIRSSELECHKIVGRWFKQSGQDAPLVAEAIQAGLHGNNPVAYISAILKNRIEQRNNPQPFHYFSKPAQSKPERSSKYAWMIEEQEQRWGSVQ